MISLFIQGFSPVLPAILLIIILAFSIALSWWSYQYLTSIPLWKKTGLITLRASALTILLLLLFNPFLQITETEIQNPEIYIYLDDSQSVDITRGEYNGLESYQEILSSLESNLDDNFEYTFHLFDNEVREGSEVEALGTATNIQTAVEHIADNQNDMVSAILISDGIYTRGRNPIFTAQNQSTPIFTIPIGDTTDVRDVLISDVGFNSTAYLDTRETIRVEIQQSGYPNEVASVDLYRNGELYDEREVEFIEETSSHEVQFDVEYDEEGVVQYEVDIPGLPEEFTLQNNTETFAVDVLDARTNILSLAFEVHPDVASIRRLIASDRQNELTSTNFIRDGVYTNIDPTTEGEDYDLIVLHGLPSQNDPITAWLNEQDETPMVLFQTPAGYQQMDQAEVLDAFPHSVSTTGSILDVHLNLVSDRASHPILEFTAIDFRRFPTVKTMQTDYSLSALAESHIMAEYQRNETDIPIVVTELDVDRRSVFINAFGWFRYATSANEEVNNFYNEFFTNVISWASTSPDEDNLTIQPADDSFTENENIVIRGNLVNERGEPEPDALIELELELQEEEETQQFRMNSIGNGEYEVDLGTFPEGFYRVRAEATKGDRTIGGAETSFNVGQSTLEFMNTRRNDQLLTQLSARTGGLFLSDHQLGAMYDLLSERGLNEQIERIHQENRYLYSMPFWFFIVIVLLSAEWILRRTISLP